MRYYPVFLDLQGKRCLIVGAGDVGRRKLEGLLPCYPAEVLVLDTQDPGPDFARAQANPAVRFEKRTFAPKDVEGCTLVFACTSNKQVNAAVADACREHGILCNIIDDPTAGKFIVPAHFASGDILVALSTGGHSPALARRIRMELQEYLGDRFAKLATFMGRVRPLVLALGNETRQNTILFRELINSELIDALEANDKQVAKAILFDLLPDELHSHIGDLLHDLT